MSFTLFRPPRESLELAYERRSPDVRTSSPSALNSLLRALDRVGVSVSIDGREARTLVAHVAVYGGSFTLDAVPVGNEEEVCNEREGRY